MRTGRFVALLLVLCAVGLAPAAPYWIAWEGDDWPENDGWTRNVLNGGDERTLADGVMTLDGLNTGPGFVWDGYEWYRPAAMDPGPGETFVIQWRMRVEAIMNGNWDPSVSIFSDDAWAVYLDFAIDRVWSAGEGPAAQVHFAPGVFHQFELRSPDMRSYQLFIDGVLARAGGFAPAVTPSSIVWGDGGGATRSRSTWDYFRFGVVPEANAAVLALVPATWVARVRRL